MRERERSLLFPFSIQVLSRTYVEQEHLYEREKDTLVAKNAGATVYAPLWE